MVRRLKVAELDEIEDGDGKCVDVDIDRVAIFNVGGKYHALSDTCPHAGGPLSEGWVDDYEVTCPWHGWTFPLESNDGNDGITRYRLSIEEDGIYIHLTA